MRYLLLLAFLVFNINANAQQVVTEVFKVEVEALIEGGKSDMNRLKEKALFLAQDKFPSLIEGTESLRNGNYNQDIKSVTLVYAETKVLSSHLILNGARLKGEVQVTLDVSKSLSLLRDLQLKKQLKKDVDALVLKMMQLMAGDMSELDAVALQALRVDVEVTLLEGGDLAGAKKAVERRIESVIQERAELMRIWGNNAKWEITKINTKDDTLHINVSVPDMQKQHEALVAKYDADLFPSGVSGAVCGISKVGLHFMVDAFPVAGNWTLNDRKQRERRVAKELRFKFAHNNSDADVELFKSSFKVVPCY
jgi:hypothetical protein